MHRLGFAEDNVLYSSNSASSPFAVTLDTGYRNCSENANVLVKIRQKNNSLIWADAIITRSGSNITVVEVLASSSIDSSSPSGYALPTFTPPVEIYSTDISSVINRRRDGGMDMIGLVHQSNMVGWDTNASDPEVDYTDSLIFQLASVGTINSQDIAANEIVRASDPLKHPNWTSGSSVPPGSVGMAMTLCHELLRLNGRQRPFLQAPCAVGSTGLSTDNWNPGNTEETNARAKINTGFTKSKYNRLSLIVSSGGEDDAQVSSNANDIDNETAKQSFLYRMLHWIDTWRKTDGTVFDPEGAGSLVQTNDQLAHVPWLICGLSPAGNDASPSRNTVHGILATIPNYRPYTAFVDSRSPSDVEARSIVNGSTVDDPIHINGNGQREMGRRAAAALATALANVSFPAQALPPTLAGSGASNTQITATDEQTGGAIKIGWHLNGAAYPPVHTIKLQYTLSTDTGWSSPTEILLPVHGGLDWDSGTTYVIGDQVFGTNGVFYRCILGHTNQAPPNGTYWAAETQTNREKAGFTNHTITGLTDTTEYRVRGKNVSAFGESASWSNEVLATPTASGPSVPATLIRLRKNVGLINDSDVAATGTDFIKVWQDQSGNNHHAEQGTILNMGARVNTGNNVGAVGLTTGTNNDWYIFNKQGLSNWNGDKTFIIQFTPTAGTSRILFSTRDSATGNTHGLTIWFNGTANTIECFGGTSGSVTLNNGGSTAKQWLAVSVSSSGTVNMYWNTANTISGDTTSSGSITEATGKDQLTLAKYKLLTNGLDGSVTHIDVDNTVMSQADIHSVVSNHYDAS